MKIRSALLVACIVVVPLIAMFSHRCPAGTRAAVAAFLRDLSRPRPTAAPAVPAAPAAAAPVETAATPPTAVATLPAPETGVASASLGRLRDLGAVAIDCRPLSGRTGHVASCRLPVDGAGQLERVFQATGIDASTAADNLLREVTVWRRGAAPESTSTMRF